MLSKSIRKPFWESLPESSLNSPTERPSLPYLKQFQVLFSLV
ncbi:MAG: hypothetical protein WHU95_04210 [candidate division WOR-3 bacterium]|nr:hypothetical protein [candidate division WOR-3 bacterium]MDH7518882.1 hypothetical protein [bacterium]